MARHSWLYKRSTTNMGSKKGPYLSKKMAADLACEPSSNFTLCLSEGYLAMLCNVYKCVRAH